MRNYLFDLRSNQKKEDSRQMRNVKEKLSQIQPKSVNDQIQNIKKLFNFYAIKKHETADISKENIRMNFSNKNLKKDELENHKFDEFYNFKLPRNLKYEINFLNEKKEKNFELEENFFDETPIKRKKIDWLEIRKTKKIYYSMKIENENNLKLSRNLYCE